MYKAVKMGLVNFWIYDEEEYEFYDGKLLLRGKNGSGKSVTLQSFIPLILDGNKSPKRLDTFGGSDKHIDYYILGDDRQESTAYLYMEFYNKSLDKYVTIGIGLSLKRGKNVDFWGFALVDGTRIGEDFRLYKVKDGFNKTPLTKIELKTRLAGTSNRFVITQKDYKCMVNELLYGFSNIEYYDELINIILQIRSPKLSKEFKPTDLMKTLNDVLPPLSDEDLRPLSDTIESLNSTKEKLDNLSTKISELNMFIKVFNNYNETILYGKAKRYFNRLESHEELVNKEKSLLESISVHENDKSKLESDVNDLKLSYEKACIEKEQIDNSDIKAKKDRQSKLENEIRNINDRIKRDSNTLDNINSKRKILESELEKLQMELDIRSKGLEDSIRSVENQASLIHFDELIRYLSMVNSSDYKDYENIVELVKNNEVEIERVRSILFKRDDKIKELDVLQSDIDDINSKYDEIVRIYNELLQKCEDEKEEFINKLVRLNDEHKELKFNEDELKDIISVVQEFNVQNYLEAKDKYKNVSRLMHDSIVSEISSMKSRLANFKSELSIEEEKLDELKKTKEIVLESSELESRVYEDLDSRGVKYLSFYKAIDFKVGLDKDITDKLEANLLSSGLLEAKIILKEDIDKVKDMNITYVVPTLKQDSNLTKYFDVSEQVTDFSKEYINSILESISIDDKAQVYLNPSGYSFDVFKGNNINYESKYIGFLSRKKEHEKKISEQENVVSLIRVKIDSTQGVINSLNGRLNILKEEENDFPSNEKIIELEKSIESKKLEEEHILKEKSRLEDKNHILSNELRELELELGKVKGVSKIPVNLASYDEAYGIIKIIREDINNIKILISERDNFVKLIESNKDHLDDSVRNYEELFSSISDLKTEVNIKQVEVDTIKEFTLSDEFREWSQRLDEINLIITTYNEKSSKLSLNLGRIINEITNENQEILDVRENKRKSEIILEIYKGILEEEIGLGYIEGVSALDVSGILKKLESNGERDKTVATSNYYAGFNKYRQSLVDYNLADVMIFEDNDALITMYENKGILREELVSIFSEGARQDITAIYQSKKVNLYSLLASLKDDYESNRIYLDDRDNYLFHDILLKTVGTKIKDKINSAVEWVNNINKVMSEKQDKSNLSFHLSWVSKSKESLDEMDTRELVEIFKMDPDSVNPALTDKLIKHFKAKISKREETMVDNRETYFDIVFSILDYRNWYEFKLFYKKDGKDRRELTNKIFSVFSGGEKAKTMYIPLFASMCAKLQGALEEAPRLIALDEAFAGVDDQNIEEMFGILESFELDYLLTSQALWCDYSAVRDISICELIGDKISNTIGVKRYRWNGKVRVSLDE